MSLYSILLLVSIAVPLLLSFDRKLQFYRNFSVVLPSIAVVAAIYIIPDIYLTGLGVWGFNARYHSGILLLGLPLEEWLFFLVIPYASLFIHYSFFAYFPKRHLTPTSGKILTAVIMVFTGVILLLHLQQLYTVYILSFLLLALLLTFFDKTRVIDKVYVSFLIIVVPFLIVNGILTGSFIHEEVVWYNPSEILGIRVFTIPIEDFAYGFTMVLFNLLLIETVTASQRFSAR